MSFPVSGPPKPGEVVIRVHDLWKSFGQKKVLNGVDLELRCGATLVVLGASGSGKSVFLKHLNGLLQPDRGEVEVLGQLVSTLQESELIPLRRRVAYVFQQGALFDSLTVGENVAFGLVEGRLLSAHQALARARELLARVGLEGTENLLPAQLSGGMRKRVALARALALEPEIILYDEPTAGLDPLTGAAIAQLIGQVARESCATSLVVTHDLLVAQSLPGELAFLSQGRFAFRGNWEEALQHGGEVSAFLTAGGLYARA